MVSQSARKGQIKALLHDNEFKNPATQKLAKVLESDDVFDFLRTPPMLTGEEAAAARASGELLGLQHYNMLLDYLNGTGRDYRSAYANVRYPPGTLIMPIHVHQHSQSTVNKQTFSCKESHEGNSHIRYYVPGGNAAAKETGCIEAIWELPIDNIMQTFFLVRQHSQLPAGQRYKSPYNYFPCSVLQTSLVKEETSQYIHIIEARHIISHLTVYKWPRGTYDIPFPTMAICWAMNRGRR